MKLLRIVEAVMVIGVSKFLTTHVAATVHNIRYHINQRQIYTKSAILVVILIVQHVVMPLHNLMAHQLVVHVKQDIMLKVEFAN